MNVDSLMDVLNYQMYSIFGFPPMLLILGIPPLFLGILLVVYEKTVRDQESRMDTPGLVDIPLALAFSWCAAAYYGLQHEDHVTAWVFIMTILWGFGAFALTLPILWARVQMRKRKSV